MAQGQLLVHHPGRVADGCDQAQHHADDRGTTAVGLRDADHGNTAERHGHPGGQQTREPLVQQPPAEQRKENRADVDEHRGGAGVDVTLAPVERNHVQPEPEQPRAEDSGPGCPGRQPPPRAATPCRGRERPLAGASARARPARNARPRYGSLQTPKLTAPRSPLPLRQREHHHSPRQARRQIVQPLANNGRLVRTPGMSILLGAGPPDR